MRRSNKRVRALQLIRDNPGLNAAKFATLYWPHLVPYRGRMVPALKAAQYLCWLRRAKFIFRRYSSRFMELGAAKPHAIYFLSEFGFETLHEDQNRIRRSRCLGGNAGRH